MTCKSCKTNTQQQTGIYQCSIKTIPELTTCKPDSTHKRKPKSKKKVPKT